MKEYSQIQNGAQVNHIWRFYLDQDRRWRWQRLSMYREVISESHAAYKDYEGCVADARGKGYVYEPSQAKLIQGGHSRGCDGLRR